MNNKLAGIVLAVSILASVLVVMAPVGTPETFFNAHLSTHLVNLSDDFFIEGTSSDGADLNILIVLPGGGRIDGSSGGVIYHRIAAVNDTDTFSMRVSVGPEVMTGNYLVLVLSPGRDNVYNGFAGNVGVSDFVYELEDQYGPLYWTPELFIETIKDATINAAGSDDSMWTDYIAVERAGTRLFGAGTRLFGACTYREECVMSRDMKELECDCTFHWTGDAAASLADYIDANYYSTETLPGIPDGLCSEEELKDYMYLELNRLQKEEIMNNLFIDDTRGKTIESDCKFRYPGYGAIREDLEIKCTYWIGFRDLEDSDQHVYSETGLNDGDYVSFTVPEGWIISAVEDLNGSSISADNKTVIGIATSNAHVIKFLKAGISSPSITITPAPSPTLTASQTPVYTPLSTITQTPSPTETPTPAEKTPEEPGFEMMFAIAGLLAVAYSVLRRRNKKA